MRTPTLAPRRDDDTTAALPAAALRALAVLVFSLGGAQAAAQGAVPCTAIENDRERLACYDRALRPVTPPNAPVAAPLPPTAAPAAPPPAPTERRAERRVRETTIPAARPPGAPPAAREPEAAPDVVTVVVVSVRVLPGREATFTTGDGATWVQTDSQRLPRLPEAPFDAQIRPGAMGSFFLQPQGVARAIRVRAVTGR